MHMFGGYFAGKSNQCLMKIRFPLNKSCQLNCPSDIYFKELFEQLVNLAMIPYVYKNRPDVVTVEYFYKKSQSKDSALVLFKKKIYEICDQKQFSIKISFPFQELRQDQAGIYGIKIEQVIVVKEQKKQPYDYQSRYPPSFDKGGVMIGQTDNEGPRDYAKAKIMQPQQTEQQRQLIKQRMELQRKLQQIKQKQRLIVKKNEQKPKNQEMQRYLDVVNINSGPKRQWELSNQQNESEQKYINPGQRRNIVSAQWEQRRERQKKQMKQIQKKNLILAQQQKKKLTNQAQEKTRKQARYNGSNGRRW